MKCTSHKIITKLYKENCHKKWNKENNQSNKKKNLYKNKNINKIQNLPKMKISQTLYN